MRCNLRHRAKTQTICERKQKKTKEREEDTKQERRKRKRMKEESKQEKRKIKWEGVRKMKKETKGK